MYWKRKGTIRQHTIPIGHDHRQIERLRDAHTPHHNLDRSSARPDTRPHPIPVVRTVIIDVEQRTIHLAQEGRHPLIEHSFQNSPIEKSTKFAHKLSME